jgi:hypothetical protein
MRRTIVLLAAAALLIVAGTASAGKPDKLFVPLDGSFDIVGFCEDDLVLQEGGHIQFITHYDRTGNLKFDSALPAVKITVTNPATGLSLTDMDIGLDKFTPTADGGGVVLSTGIHLKTKGPDGIIFKRIGLQVFTFDSDGNLVSEEFHGTFDFVDDDAFAAAVCAALGSTPAV